MTRRGTVRCWPHVATRGVPPAVRALALVVGALALVGCARGAPELEVSSAQASRPVAGTAQIVLELTNRGGRDDTLVAVTTDAALGVEFHLTELVDGRATMRLLDEVALPAGETVRFRPGGLHLMAIVPDPTLAPGDTFPLTLEFARSPAMTLEVEVVELLDLVEDGAAP